MAKLAEIIFFDEKVQKEIANSKEQLELRIEKLKELTLVNTMDSDEKKRTRESLIRDMHRLLLFNDKDLPTLLENPSQMKELVSKQYGQCDLYLNIFAKNSVDIIDDKEVLKIKINKDQCPMLMRTGDNKYYYIEGEENTSQKISAIPIKTNKELFKVPADITSNREELCDLIKSQNGRIHYKSELKKSAFHLSKMLFDLKSDLQLNNVLSAYLWHKVENKNEYLAYYKGMQEELSKNNQFGNSTEDRSKKVFDISKLNSNSWLNEEFSAKDVGGDIDKFTYEQKIFKIISSNLKNAPLQQQAYATVNGIKFADCGETSLRNFFKIILNRDGKYDITIFDKIKYKINSGNSSDKIAEIKKFFSDFNTVVSQNTQEARDAWGKLASNLKNVNYLKGLGNTRCEINAGAKNMLAVIQTLLGLDDKTDWEKLMDIISESSGRTIKITEDHLPGNNLGFFRFTTPHEGDFNWHFQSGHFYIEPIFS